MLNPYKMLLLFFLGLSQSKAQIILGLTCQLVLQSMTTHMYASRTYFSSSYDHGYLLMTSASWMLCTFCSVS